MGSRTPAMDYLLLRMKDETDNCILWRFALDNNGYAKIRYKGKVRSVGRVVLHITTGFDLDSTLQAIHSCDTPDCINKRHFSPGTAKQNAMDARLKGRTNHAIRYHCGGVSRKCKPTNKIN